jgi:hypothetical protein
LRRCRGEETGSKIRCDEALGIHPVEDGIVTFQFGTLKESDSHRTANKSQSVKENTASVDSNTGDAQSLAFELPKDSDCSNDTEVGLRVE